MEHLIFVFHIFVLFIISVFISYFTIVSEKVFFKYVTLLLEIYNKHPVKNGSGGRIGT